MTRTQRSLAPASAYRDTTTELVERYLPMVRKLAWHLQGFAGLGFDTEDLMQAGLVALTECAQRHGGSELDGFAAYAKIRVKGAMVDQIRRFAPVTRGGARRRRELAETERRLRGQFGRAPYEAEVARAMDITLAQLSAMRAISAPLKFDSIDETYSDCDAGYEDLSPSAFEKLLNAESSEALATAISNLPERLQLVVQLYFVEELNLAEIASILGLSVPRIHQLKDQALKALKSILMQPDAA